MLASVWINHKWDCGGNLGPRRDREEDHMYSQERRRLAIETFIKFDHSYADTIAELGYPTRSALRRGGTGTRGPARCPQAGLPRTRGTPPGRGGEPPGTTPGTAGARQGRRGPLATPRAAGGPASGPAGSRRDGEGTEVRGPGGRRFPSRGRCGSSPGPGRGTGPPVFCQVVLNKYRIEI